MYLVIVGTDKCKTDEEREFEDKEQMNYLRNYKNGDKSEALKMWKKAVELGDDVSDDLKRKIETGVMSE